METLIRRYAGLDVHKASVVAGVRVIDQNGELLSFTQSFGTTTTDLLKLNAWLMSYVRRTKQIGPMLFVNSKI